MPSNASLVPSNLRRLPVLAGLLALCGTALTQAAIAQAATPQPPAPPPESSAVEQRIERIRLEDGGTVIEEVRYGGTPQSITVSPKAGVPGYEIQPSGGTRSPALSRESLPGAPGQRVWNVLKF